MQASSGGEWLCLVLVLAGVAAWVDEEGEDDGFEYTEDGWRINPEDMYRENGNDYSDDAELDTDETINALIRSPARLGNENDEYWLGNDNRKYNVSQDGGVSGGGGGMFRSSGGLKSRGHFTHINKDPDLLPHEPNAEDPKGCGNPLCVVLDRKVFRFRSLCAYSSHICTENRKDQMNYIQKGDCYDIINGKKKGGAHDKPWTPKDQDLGDCGECRKDENCNQKITFNIDLKNIVKGTSSAFGGDSFHETAPSHGEGKRWVGLPIEFDNICLAMKYFQGMENLNMKTQVLGIAFGARDDLFPTDSKSEKCLWTEWFDHDTPCNSDGDHEKHTEHFERLYETITGPLRICGPGNMVGATQHEGGSEVTQVSAEDAKAGQARGTGGKDSKAFKQEITTSKLEVECVDTKQTIEKLPPPFIYFSGESSDPKKKATCLDYKTRYCCRSSEMYRPTRLDQLEMLMPPRCPLGPIFSDMLEDGSGANLKVFPLVGGNKEPAIISLTFQGKSASASIQDGGMNRNYQGSLFTEKGKTTKGGAKIDRFVAILFPANSKNQKPEEKCTIKLDVSGGSVIRSDIKHSDDTYCGTKISEGKNGQGRRKGTTQVKCKGMKKSEMHIVSYDDGQEVMRDQGNWESCSARSGGRGNSQIGTWENLANLNQAMQTKFFIESPPLAGIFAECEWMDWISEEYPNKHRTGREWELRIEVAKKKKMRRHVCGDVPEAAHYVDAVTTEKRIPWYELKTGMSKYEAYKLSPFHGYLCADSNTPNQPEYCQDMKVRYCCVKTLRAQWSEWQEWSKCTMSCGGGTQVRKKICKQSKYRKQGSDLYKKAYNRKCIGEESDIKKKLCSEQTRRCNEEGCPVEFKWAGWSMWTGCSVTCDKGTKVRIRSCHPAESGGTPCPEKNKENLRLYEEKMDCSRCDCESYRPTRWSGWSACSTTCGLGQMRRSRGCESMRTLKPVDGKHCAPPNNKFYEQTEVCKLADCPIDGGWGRWEEWGRCIQNCVYHPSSAKSTKAFRARRRYCNKPLPAFGGKKCKKDSKYRWVSHLKAEEERGECCTEDNHDKCEGDVTPWCPENCIYSKWSVWSPCSQTCIEYDKLLSFHGGYNPSGTHAEKRAERITISPPCEPSMLPVQERYRMILKKERFGGTCDILLMAKNKTGKQDMLFQDRRCYICKEHCPIPAGSGKEVVNWPLLPYPGKNAQCIGYCPLNCGWEDPECPTDCEKEQEEYFAKTKDKLEKEYHCYNSKVVLEIIQSGREPEEADAFIKNVNTMIDQSRDEGYDAYPDYWKELPSLKVYTGKAEDGSAEKNLQRTLPLAWTLDRENIIKLTHKITRKMAIVPNLDGQFGGKPCIRNSDKKQLTIRESKDKEFDKKTMTNGIPRDQKEFYGVCHLQICPPVKLINDEIQPVHDECKNLAWTPWGEWGKCSEICGDKGTRKRHRKCVDMCTEEKKEHKGKCEPFMDTIANKNYTDTDWTHCSPCPAHLKSEWSQWGEWERVDPPGCGECSPCGEPGEMLTLERTRVCIANKKGEKKCKKDSGDNSDRQERKIPKSPCESDEGVKYKDGVAENVKQSYSGGTEDDPGQGKTAQSYGAENSSEGSDDGPDEGGDDGPDGPEGGSEGPDGPDEGGADGPEGGTNDPEGGAGGPDGPDEGGTNDPEGGADDPEGGSDDPEGGAGGPDGPDEGGADGPDGGYEEGGADGSQNGDDGPEDGAGGPDGPEDGSDGPEDGSDDPEDGSDDPEDGPDKNGGYENSSEGGADGPQNGDDGPEDGPEDGAGGPDGGSDGPDDDGADGTDGPEDGGYGPEGGTNGPDEGGSDGPEDGADGPGDGADGPDGPGEEGSVGDNAEMDGGQSSADSNGSNGYDGNGEETELKEMLDEAIDDGDGEEEEKYTEGEGADYQEARF